MSQPIQTLFAGLLLAMPLAAQSLPTQPPPRLSANPSDTSHALDWDGFTGRSYFVQRSFDLKNWSYFPTLTQGSPDGHHFAFGSDAAKMFVRLCHVDAITTWTDDFDTDGLRNGFELDHSFNLGIDPLRIDSNGNGTPDGDEDPDGDGLTNAEEQGHDTLPDQSDSDGDGQSDMDEVVAETNPRSDMPPLRRLQMKSVYKKAWDGWGLGGIVIGRRDSAGPLPDATFPSSADNYKMMNQSLGGLPWPDISFAAAETVAKVSGRCYYNLMYSGDNLEHKRVFFMRPYKADSTVNVPVVHRLRGPMVFGGGETMHVVTVQILAGEKSAFLDLVPEFVTGFDGDIEESYTLLSDYPLSIEFNADNEDDGDIDAHDDEVEETRALVVPLKLNKPEVQSARKIILRTTLIGSATLKLHKSGEGKITVHASNGTSVLANDATESSDLVQLLSNGELELKVFGEENGTVNLTVNMHAGSETLVEDKLLLRVVNADLIFRNGNQALANMIAYNYTHGGLDTGDNHVYDIAGSGVQTNQSITTFFSKAATSDKKRMVFSLSNYMGGRIIEKLFDNLKSGLFENPTAQEPWNLFTSADDYMTSNCLEWLHHQWMKAAVDVYAELSDNAQKVRFKQAYLEAEGGPSKPMVGSVLLETGPFEDPMAYSLYLTALESYIDIQIALEDRDNKVLWDNTFEGVQHVYYLGWHNTPIADVPWYVKVNPLSVLLYHGHLRTITPQSYGESALFEEVPY